MHLLTETYWLRSWTAFLLHKYVLIAFRQLRHRCSCWAKEAGKNLRTISFILKIFSGFRGSLPPTPLILRPSSSLGMNICRSSWTEKFLSEVDFDHNWNMTSLSVDWEGQAGWESRSGTNSIGTGGTGVAGGTGVTEEAHVGRTGTFGCSGGPERTAINTSRRSCFCCYCSASCFWRSEISFRYPRISGWLSGNAANRLCWTGRTGDTPCKGLDATLAICGDGRTTCMACKEAAGICSGESGITAIRWGGLTCGGLYWEAGTLFSTNSIVAHNCKQFACVLHSKVVKCSQFRISDVKISLRWEVYTFMKEKVNFSLKDLGSSWWPCPAPYF